jgi:uncharacterized membrane protein (UPF0182 family)
VVAASDPDLDAAEVVALDGDEGAAEETSGAPPATAEGTPPAAAVTVTGPLAQQARAHYERAIAAQRRGDWAAYGEALTELERVLREMAPRRGERARGNANANMNANANANTNPD